MKRSKPIISSTKSRPGQPLPGRQTTRELRDLQRLMAQAVMRPLTPAGGMRRTWVDGRPTQTVAARFIKPNDRLSSFERLEIYNRQYWYRVLDCFYEDFPGLHALLGTRKFHRLSVLYLSRFPSSTFSLRNLGQHLVRFIQRAPALDMARLEWAHIEAFDNEARTAAPIDDLLGLEADQIHLRLQPHITLLQLSCPLDDYLISVKKHAGLRNEASNAVAFKSRRVRVRLRRFLKPEAIHLAVHRFQNRVYYKRLRPVQFGILSALADGASLAEACAILEQCTPAEQRRHAKQIQHWFSDWAALGWFCSRH